LGDHLAFGHLGDRQEELAVSDFVGDIAERIISQVEPCGDERGVGMDVANVLIKNDQTARAGSVA